MDEVRPWHLFSEEPVSAVIIEERISLCQECDKYVQLTKQCKECWCIMPLKVKLAAASCPLGKWSAIMKED